MKIDLRRIRDGAHHLFEWTAFRGLQLFPDPNTPSPEIASGFMLSRSNPHRYNIVFSDVQTRDEIRSKTDELRNEWQTRLGDALKEKIATIDISDAAEIELLRKQERELYRKFVDEASSASLDAHAQVGRLCYWDAGNYEICLEVETTGPSRSFKKSWEFKLQKSDFDNLRLNTGRILDEVCGQNVSRYNFTKVPYETVTS